MTDFNKQADYYAQFRPTYPSSVAASIAKLVRYRGVAWDVGTGTGQMAIQLAAHFNLVCATDIGEHSLSKATPHKGVLYGLLPAEQTDFPADFFDVIVAAQSAHWFNLDAFYAEVNRVAAPGAVLAIVGYGRAIMPDDVQRYYDEIENGLLKDYWSPRTILLDEHYRNIPFPFEEVNVSFEPIKVDWTVEQLKGFMLSWSAVQEFVKDGHQQALDKALGKFITACPAGETIPVQFPVFGRVGFVRKSG